MIETSDQGDKDAEMEDLQNKNAIQFAGDEQTFKVDGFQYEYSDADQ